MFCWLQGCSTKTKKEVKTQTNHNSLAISKWYHFIFRSVLLHISAEGLGQVSRQHLAPLPLAPLCRGSGQRRADPWAWQPGLRPWRFRAGPEPVTGTECSPGARRFRAGLPFSYPSRFLEQNLWSRHPEFIPTRPSAPLPSIRLPLRRLLINLQGFGLTLAKDLQEFSNWKISNFNLFFKSSRYLRTRI